MTTLLDVTAHQSLNFKTYKEPRNRFKGINSASLCSLAGQYYNPIPNRFLVPKKYLKIPAQASGIDSMESIPGLLKRFINSSSVLEFLNILWGLGTEQEQGCCIGRPAYTAWRNWFFEIDSCAP
jgi:hypothetical protein